MSSLSLRLPQLAIFAFITFASFPVHASTVASQDFGSSPIATPVNLSIAIPAVTPGPASISLRYSIDFSIGACTPTTTGCTIPVTFDPKKPGLRQDALVVRDANGLVVEEVFLHGIGLGTVPVFSPAIATLQSCLGGLCGYLTASGIAAEPNGKILILSGNPSTLCEFDPATGNCLNVPSLPPPSDPFPVLGGLAVDSAGNAYYGAYGTVAPGIHRLDAVTGNDALVVSGLNIGGFVVTPAGTIYYSQGDQVFSANPNSYAITLIAGNGIHGFGGDGGLAVNAELASPGGVAVDRVGNVYVADYRNQRVRKIDLTGTITTIAGDSEMVDSGDGGPAIDASLYFPGAVIIDAAGDLYILEANLTRRIDAGTGLISTVANGAYPAAPFFGVGSSASALSVPPGAMTLDADGNLWSLGESGLYEISRSANPLQFPFHVPGQTATQSFSLLNAGNSSLSPLQVSITGLNPTDFSQSNTCAAELAPGTACNISVTFIAGSHATPEADITFADNAPSSPQTVPVSGISGSFTPAQQQISAVAVGSASVTPQIISVQFAGNASGLTAVLAYGVEFSLGIPSCSGAATVSCSVPVTFKPRYPGLRQDSIEFLDATGTVIYQCFLSATSQGPQWFVDPEQLGSMTVPSNTQLSAIDLAGNLYAVPAFSGSTAGVVYRFTQTTGQWTIVAGQLANSGYNSGDGGPATSATLAYVNAVMLDAAGNMYIGETFGIRRVDARTGVITTVAQQGGDVFAMDNHGYIYFSTLLGYQVKRIDPSNAVITSYAGNGGTGASSGDGGPATTATLSTVYGLGFDAANNLFISTYLNLRRVDANSGIITTYSESCDANSLMFDAAGDLLLPCGDIGLIPPGGGTPQLVNTSTLYNVFGSILRDPSGTIYTSAGAILGPGLQTAFNMPSAILGSSSSAVIGLRNSGNEALPVAGIALSGANPALLSQNSTCGQNLLPAQNCAVNLAFTPVQSGTVTATLTVSSTLPPLQTTISAAGLQGTLQFNVNSMDFGTQPSSSTIEITLQLFNVSSVPVTISGISISGANASDFTDVSYCPSVLGAGRSCLVYVLFHAGASGTHSAMLNIVDNAAGSPQVIPLTAVVSGTAFVSSENPGSLRNNDTGFFGFQFTVGAAPIQVYSLGRFLAPGNASTHLVKLLQANGSDLAGGSTTLLVSDNYAGSSWSYGTLASPVTLTANTTYYLVSQETAGGDEWYDAGPITTSTAATVLGPAYSDSTHPLSTVSGMAGSAYGPLNFLYRAVASLSAQTITFQPLSAVTSGVAPFTLSATASSGLPVSYTSSTTAVCTVSGSTVTVLAAGTCTITASQNGNSTYAAAAPVNQSFSVTAAPYISYVVYWGVNNTGVTISWSTNMPATTQLDYGTTTALGQLSPLQTTLASSHGVTLNNLNPGTKYYFAAQSTSASGATGYSTTYSFSTSGTAAAPAPAISNVTESNITSTSATITWATDQAASSQVNYGTSTSYGSSSTVSTSLVTSHSVTLTGLTAGTTYNFDVVSANANNLSATSANSSFTTSAASTGTAPSVGYVADWGITNTGITISWSTNVPATTQLAYGTTASLGQLSPLQTTLASSHGVVLTALNPGTTYYFVAQSTAANGATGYSTAYSFKTSGTPAASAPVISRVVATTITGNSATITWTTDQAASSLVNYGTTTAYGSSSAVNTSLVTSHSVTLTGLTGGTTYNFDVVSATAANLSSTSANSTFATAAASTGTAPYVGYVAYWGVNSTGITISWSTNTPATTQLAYGTTTALGQLSPLQTTLSSSHGVVLTTLSPGTTYYFVAQSQGTNGVTGYSTIYSFSTP